MNVDLFNEVTRIKDLQGHAKEWSIPEVTDVEIKVPNGSTFTSLYKRRMKK